MNSLEEYNFASFLAPLWLGPHLGLNNFSGEGAKLAFPFGSSSGMELLMKVSSDAILGFPVQD